MLKNTFLVVFYEISVGGLSILLIAIPTYMIFRTCKNVFGLLIMYCEMKATISNEILYYAHSLCNFFFKHKE